MTIQFTTIRQGVLDLGHNLHGGNFGMKYELSTSKISRKKDSRSITLHYKPTNHELSIFADIVQMLQICIMTCTKRPSKLLIELLWHNFLLMFSKLLLRLFSEDFMQLCLKTFSTRIPFPSFPLEKKNALRLILLFYL